jgi:hypothetical protein
MIVTDATTLNDGLAEVGKALHDRWTGFTTADLRLVWEQMQSPNTPGPLFDAQGAEIDAEFVDVVRGNLGNNVLLLRALAARED